MYSAHETAPISAERQDPWTDGPLIFNTMSVFFGKLNVKHIWVPFRILQDIGTDKGFVGCIDALKITGMEAVKEYNLGYPASEDIDLAVHISELAFCASILT